MYQFSEMFSEINPQLKKPSYRWRGLLCGMLGAWLPGWAVAHWAGGDGWAFAGVWILFIPIGYFVGDLIKK